MHVAHVIRSSAFAGVERHVAQLAGAQADMGHRVTVIGGRGPDVTAVAGDRIVHLRGDGLRPAASSLRRLLAGSSVDIVHAHMTAAEVASALMLVNSRTPLVSTRHFAQTRGRNVLVNRALTVIARRVSAQIAVSRYVAEAVEGPSTVITPGVPSRAGFVRAERREPVVLAVQRLEPEKATGDVITAFAQSRLAREGWRLDVAGEGSQRAALEALAARWGVDGAVCFLGHRNDVPQLMERSALLHAPCPSEGLGLTVLEAMASGLPVIASRSGGHLETVGSVEGAALYTPGVTTEAAALLLRLAQDARERDAYGMALQRRQQDVFTLRAQAVATEGVYRSVLVPGSEDRPRWPRGAARRRHR